MPALTAADREFLSQEWRFAETNDAAVKAQHRGAREVEIPSPFVTVDGAVVALASIAEQLIGAKRLIVLTLDAALQLSFKQRPPTVRLYHSRFGGDPLAGRLMMVEGGDTDYDADRTTIYLSGAL